MSSTTSPHINTLQYSLDHLKPHFHTPSIASPLALSSTPDTVTNDERAKAPEITRVLSPLRARRTPVLINAPDVRWRLAKEVQLRRFESGSSLRSGESGCSDGSWGSVNAVPLSPQQQQQQQQQQDNKLNAEIELETKTEAENKPPRIPPSTPTWAKERSSFRPHPLSPVLEVRTLASTTLSLELESGLNPDWDHDPQRETRTDGARSAGECVRRSDVVNVDRGVSVSGGSRGSEEEGLFCVESGEAEGKEKVEAVVNGSVEKERNGKGGVKLCGRVVLCGGMVKVKDRVQGVGNKFLQGLAERFVVWALAHAF